MALCWGGILGWKDCPNRGILDKTNVDVSNLLKQGIFTNFLAREQLGALGESSYILGKYENRNILIYLNILNVLFLVVGDMVINIIIVLIFWF